MSSEKNTITPFELLKTQVYPVLNEAMLKLIDHIVKTQQVRKHQQRLVKQKILDELEKKKIERQKQKQELGSDYFESDDQQYYKALKMNKKQVESILENRMKINSQKKNKKKQKIQQHAYGIEQFNPISFLVQQLKQIKKTKENK